MSCGPGRTHATERSGRPPPVRIGPMWSWRTHTPSVLSLLAVATTSAIAQTGTLSGTVTDKATKQPIDAVSIQIKGSNLTTRTRANGQYIILGVPPGTHAVIAKRLGYQEVEQTGVTVNI